MNMQKHKHNWRMDGMREKKFRTPMGHSRFTSRFFEDPRFAGHYTSGCTSCVEWTKVFLCNTVLKESSCSLCLISATLPSDSLITLPPVVEDVSFEVYTGEIFALLGPSGCGKTTTLRLIAGFERADAGEIRVEGKCFADSKVHLPPEVRDIGIVFQEYALFPHLNVSQNVAFGLKKLPTKLRDERVMTVLDMVGMTPFKNRKPYELSGGQQQRVALARSIAPGP